MLGRDEDDLTAEEFLLKEQRINRKKSSRKDEFLNEENGK